LRGARSFLLRRVTFREPKHASLRSAVSLQSITIINKGGVITSTITIIRFSLPVGLPSAVCHLNPRRSDSIAMHLPRDSSAAVGVLSENLLPHLDTSRSGVIERKTAPRLRSVRFRVQSSVQSGAPEWHTSIRVPSSDLRSGIGGRVTYPRICESHPADPASRESASRSTIGAARLAARSRHVKKLARKKRLGIIPRAGRSVEDAGSTISAGIV